MLTYKDEEIHTINVGAIYDQLWQDGNVTINTIDKGGIWAWFGTFHDKHSMGLTTDQFMDVVNELYYINEKRKNPMTKKKLALAEDLEAINGH